MHVLNSAFAFKIFLALLVAACLGLPVNTPWHFILLLAALVAIVALPAASLAPRKVAFIFAVLAAAVLLNHALPRASIEEGHNVFLPEGGRSSVLPEQLPPFVYTRMKQEFDRAYPPEKRCDANAPGCWRSTWNGMKPVQAPYAQSLDDVFRKAKYSRVVDGIDFSNLEELRGGFVNDIYYHWWDGDIKRSTMPYFVMYEMNDRLADSQLCWQGMVLWEQEGGRFDQLLHDGLSCKRISQEDNGRHVFGLGIDPAHPLAMNLQPNPVLLVSAIVREIFALLAIAVVLALALQWREWRRLLFPAAFIGTTALLAFVHVPEMFHGYPIMVGGDDGLTHEGFGREILRQLLAGGYANALRGGEDIYYYMPGMRYARALGLAVFGETNFGYLAAMLVLPLSAYGVMRLLLPKAWSLAILILGSVLFFKCMSLAAYGYADPMGYALFMGALWLLLNPASSLKARWAGHLILALAIFVRPNLSIAALALIIIQFWQTSRALSVRSALLSLSGFAFVLLMPIHNYIFGHRFVPFTAAAEVPANLKVPPLTYVHALRDAVAGNFNGASMNTISTHLYKFGNSWVLLLLVLGLSAWVYRKKIQAYEAHSLLLVTAGMFLPFFFFDASYRYALLAWLCAIITGTGYAYLLLSKRNDRARQGVSSSGAKA